MATQLSLGLAVQGTHFSTMAAGRDPMALWDTDFWERGEDSPSELPFCPCTVQWAMGGGWSSLPSMSPKDRGTKSAELPARAPLGGWGELAAQVAAAPKEENGVSHCSCLQQFFGVCHIPRGWSLGAAPGSKSVKWVLLLNFTAQEAAAVARAAARGVCPGLWFGVSAARGIPAVPGDAQGFDRRHRRQDRAGAGQVGVAVAATALVPP